jgi:hypothetical protein
LEGEAFCGESEGVFTIGFEGAAVVDIDLVSGLGFAAAGGGCGDFNVEWFVEGEGERGHECSEGED